MTISEEAQTAIDIEENIVASIGDTLQEQLAYSSKKLITESKRARELTSELVAATRDEDKQMLASDEAVSHAVSHLKASDIKKIEKSLDNPYFARFEVEEETGSGVKKTAEYRLGFSANPDCRIIDWRTAPISKLYYEYQEGDEFSEEIQGRERNGVISLRNSVNIKNGVLKSLTCRHGHFHKDSQNTWLYSGGGSRSRSVASASYGELPQILPLITAEQFELITTESDTAVLIQGIAGSGKTTVALHRLAWLLHEDNSECSTDDALVLVLHRALQVYTEKTLPAMGIQGVRVLTFSDWTTDTLKQILPADFIDPNGQVYRPAQKPPHAVSRVFRSLALLKSLEAAEKNLCSVVKSEIDKDIAWTEVPAGLRKLFESLSKSENSVREFLTKLLQGIERGLANMPPTHPAINSLKESKDLIANKLANISYSATIEDVLSDHQSIIGNDDTHLISKDLINQAKERFRQCLAEQSVDYDCDALYCRLAQIRSDKVYRHDGSSKKFSHIVTDEVQEFSPLELACVIGAVKNIKDVTLVGDVDQQTGQAHVFPGWKALINYWGYTSQDSRFISLTVSHRSTLPIMRFAESIQKRKTVTEGRQGRKPIWFSTRSENRGIKAAIGWLDKAMTRYPNAITAVLCRSQKEAKYVYSLLKPSFGHGVRLGDSYSFSFDEGIIVTTIAQVKGLEFLNVLIWNPSNGAYPASTASQNALYIAVTRAEENVCLVTWGRPSPVLPHLFSKVVRGVDLDADEEQPASASEA